LIFVDSNVPMYLVGDDDRLREAAQRLLERAAVSQRPLATSAEVFQEILHRYVAIKRPAAIGLAFEALASLTDVVLPVTFDDVRRARELLSTLKLSARDALHVAVMEAAGIEEIMTFDAAFDLVPSIRRMV
jgi:predicted nucleic acid-binding protein